MHFVASYCCVAEALTLGSACRRSAVGELNEWSKKTNTELATHIPMLIRVPWKKASVGARTTVKMELVDLYGSALLCVCH